MRQPFLFLFVSFLFLLSSTLALPYGTESEPTNGKSAHFNWGLQKYGQDFVKGLSTVIDWFRENFTKRDYSSFGAHGQPWVEYYPSLANEGANSTTEAHKDSSKGFEVPPWNLPKVPDPWKTKVVLDFLLKIRQDKDLREHPKLLEHMHTAITKFNKDEVPPSIEDLKAHLGLPSLHGPNTYIPSTVNGTNNSTSPSQV